MIRLAVGLSALGSLWLSPVVAAPLEGVLESTGGGAIAPWQTVYLMSEGAADSRVVGPLNRGAKVTVDPERSTDQYWYVRVPGSPGGAWQGYVWKHFVKVSDAKSASAAPAEKDAKKGKKAAKGADPLLAYDPELFEVTRDDDGPVVPRAKPALAAEPVPPPPSFSMAAAAPSPVAEKPSAAAPAQTQAPAAPQRPGEAELASPLRQIQGLREQIERELEAAPQAALSQSMDQLVVRLNEVLKVERSIVGLLESTGKMVEAHDKRIKELSTKVATLSTKGPERAGLSEEVSKMRKKLDELASTVSTTRQHAKRLEVLEARLRKSGEGPSIAGLRSPGGAIDEDRGAVVVGTTAPKKDRKAPIKTELDVEFDRRADQLEDHLYNVKRQARQLQRQIDEDDIDLPHIDARQVEKEERRERQVAEGVVEVLDAPKSGRVPPGGTVANMLGKLRNLREQRRQEREAGERRARGLAPAPVQRTAKPAAPPSAAERAAVEDAAEYEDPEPDAEPVPVKKKKKSADAARKLREIEGLLSAKLD